MKVTELYDVKYAPFADSYIGMANGDTYEHAKRWLTQRFRFCDSLFDYAPSYNNDILTIRANTTELMTLEIETYTPVYQHLSWYNGQMDKKKIDGKVETEFSGKAMAATDQEILIYGGSNVKSIKGIQSANPNRLILGSATKLIELDASNCPLLSEINMNKANLSPHTYLNKLNLENCPLLDGNLRLNASPLIREINIKGTNISGLNLPSSLRSLEVMKLPKTLTGFTLNDATSLHTLDFEEGIVLNDVSMTNCNALTNVTNFDLSNAQQVTLNNSYNTTNELYFKNASTLSLSNMDNLEKVIYTPNAEHETFDITNLTNTKDYNITTFNCPKLNTFMTTAPYRESYGKEYGEVKPNEVFEANSIDISNTQFTDVKLLCTTDTNVLKLPQTVKNLIVDSAYDLDTEYLTDGDYDTIHTELYEPYNTNYEESILKTATTNYPDFFGTEIPLTRNKFIENDGSISDLDNWFATVEFYDISHCTSIKLNVAGSTTIIYFYDSSQAFISYYDMEEGKVIDIPSNVKYARWLAYMGTKKRDMTLSSKTPMNIIPSASDGSIIQSMYVPTKTVQPASGVWDLKGLELEEYHTFGLNNDVKPSYDFIDKKSIILEGKNLNWSFSWGAYDSTTILNDGIESITPLTGADYIFNCFDKDNNNIQWVQLVQAGTKITIPENTYTIAIDCVTSRTQSAMFDVVYNVWGVSQIQMPDRYDEYSLSIKNKTVKNEIARYTASDWNTFPTFNSEFTYTYDITKLDDGIYEYSIMADNMDNLPTQISFSGKSNLLTVEYLNVDNVTNMNGMFSTCSKLTTVEGIENWNVNKVTNCDSMFRNCHSLILPNLSNFTFDSIESLSYMFQNCMKLTELDMSNWDVSKVNKVIYAFSGCINLKSIIGIDDLVTNKVTNMQNMFNGCTNLTSLDVSNFNTSNVTNMKDMFNGCNNLTSLDVSNFNTSNVNNMNSMFQGCNNLTSLDLSNFNTSEVTSMSHMFSNCSNLTSLDLSNFNTSKVTNMANMFYNCTKLASLDSMQNISVSLSLSPTQLDQTSLVDVINNLKTVTTTQTLTLGVTLLAKLTEEQIAVAVNKGWNIS